MKKTYILLIIACLIFINCGGKKEIKPSADSVITQNSLRVIDAVKNAYQEKDGPVLLENMSPELSADITNRLIFDSAELHFTPRMIKLKASTIMVNLNWHGTWVIKSDTIKNRGVAVFVLEGEPVKLIQVKGDNPFHTPIPKE